MKISLQRIAGTTAILLLMGVCIWVSFNYLVWFLPAQPATRDIALADLDGDGDLDGFLANGRNELPEPNTVLLNDGKGNFQDSGQRLGDFESWAVALHDFDGDGDMDAFIGGKKEGRIWLNDGDGKFKPTGQRLTYSRYHAAGVGDVDRNGTVDLIAARLDTATVWYNDGTGRMEYR